MMNTKPEIWCITGGIGSGKSTVARVFTQLSIPVYDADSRAKALYQESNELKLKVKSIFGVEVFSGNKIDRKNYPDWFFRKPDWWKNSIHWFIRSFERILWIGH